MTEKTDILLKQSDELMILRERSINNIISSSNSFLTFLGLVGTALAVFINKSNSNKPVEHIVLIIAGIVVFSYGCFIYHHIWSFYVNQIIYTRKLNLTRAYLVRNRDFVRRILLPLDGDTPEFNKQGHLGEDFSKKGTVSWIKWINSVSMSMLVFAFLSFYPSILNLPWFVKIIFIQLSLIFGIFGGILTFLGHEKHDKDILKKAEEEWNHLIEDKDMIHKKIKDNH